MTEMTRNMMARLGTCILSTLGATILGAPVLAQEPDDSRFALSPLAGPAPATPQIDEEAVRFYLDHVAAPLAQARERYSGGVPYTLEVEQSLGGVCRSALRFPSAAGNSEDDQIHALLFAPDPPPEQRGPGLVLLHHLRDDVTIESMVATWFAQHGIHVVLMYMPGYGPRRAPGRSKLIESDLGRLERSMAQAVLDVHATRDWLRHQPQVDPARLSQMGVSLGALISSIALGMDPGTTGPNLLLLGGGDLTTILYTESRYTRRLVQDFRAQGLTQAEVRARLLRLDPLTWASRVPRDSVSVFNVRQDEVIPMECTRALIERLPGRVTESWYSGSHIGLAFYLPSVLRSCGELLLTPVDPAASRTEDENPLP